MSIAQLKTILDGGLLSMQVPTPQGFFITPSAGLQAAYDAANAAVEAYTEALVAESVADVPAVVSAVGKAAQAAVVTP